MIHEIYSVRDAAAEAYLPPFAMQTLGAAIRAFTDTCNDPNSNLNNHPEDYTLFRLGIFDDRTGLYELEEGGPRRVGSALDFIVKEKNTESSG